MNIIGSTKLQNAHDSIEKIMSEMAEEQPDTRINDVAIILDISCNRNKSGSTGYVVYSCSDERPWVQDAFFRRAADAVHEEPADDQEE